MNSPVRCGLLALLIPNLAFSDPVKAVVDTHQPGWRGMTQDDFTKVNSAADTWTWKEGVLLCTGQPVRVMRTTKTYRNFEFSVEWMHEKPAGNSGIFVWTTPASIERLAKEGKPGLPDGIEVQVLDNAFTDRMAKAGQKTDWFTTHGDVFPVRVAIAPIGKTSPNGEEVSGGTACNPADGYLCLESQRSPVQFRNLRIRELP